MRSSTLITFLLFVFGCMTLTYGQSLSNIGARHWKTANTLYSMAASLEQKEMAIAEYERVKESDPNYSETYFKLGTIYFELAKEYKVDEYFEHAKENYLKYKSLNPQDSDKIDDEIYLIESVKQMTQKSSSRDETNTFVGVWINKSFPRISYIFRIKKNGDSYDVSVSTAEERVLDTSDVIFDGETLCFTVRDVDHKGSPHTISWEENGRIVEVVCDVEEDVDFWKLSYANGNLSATNEWINKYSLNGKVKRRRHGSFTWILSRR